MADAMLNGLWGPNPLLLILISASLTVGFVGILLSGLSLLITEVLCFGLSFPLFAAAMFITLVRPRWALPKWMREVDERRATRPDREP